MDANKSRLCVMTLLYRLQSGHMLPRRVFQLLAQRVAAPRSQSAAFASAASARLSKPVPSSNGISLEAAVKKVQESATAKFDETVDIAGESLGS